MIFTFKMVCKEDYDKSLEYFGQALRDLEEDLCVFIYGSYLRDDFVPGRSDLDGGIIVQSDVVIPRNIYSELSRSFLEVAKKFEGVQLNFNLLDFSTSQDGRFLSYTDDYTDYIKGHGRVVFGENYLDCLNGLNYRYSVLESIAFNLRKVRNHALRFDSYTPQEFRGAFNTTLKTLADMPKKLVHIRNGSLILGNSSVNKLGEILPDYDLSIVSRISNARKDVGTYNELFGDKDFYWDCITATEEMIKCYLLRFPKISDREVKAK